MPATALCGSNVSLSAALTDVTDRSCVIDSLEFTSVLFGSEDEAYSFESRRSPSCSLLRAP